MVHSDQKRLNFFVTLASLIAGSVVSIHVARARIKTAYSPLSSLKRRGN